MSIYKYYVQVGRFHFFFFWFIGSHHTFLYLFASYNLVKMEKKQNILSLHIGTPGGSMQKKKIYTITKRCLKITHNLVKLIHHLDIFNHQLINYTYCKISLQTRRTNNVALIFCFQRKKLRNIFWCIFNLPPKLHLQSLKSIEIYENLVCSLKKKKN